MSASPCELGTNLGASRATRCEARLSPRCPREVEWRDEAVETAIFKSPVSGRVAVTALNLAGDRQADLSVHGGTDKAVYAYPSEHYAYWRENFTGVPLSWSAFGENLTLEGVPEAEVRVGDLFRIGTAELVVTQPRLPCYKLNVRFGRLTGFYFSVRKEGHLAAGDAATAGPGETTFASGRPYSTLLDSPTSRTRNCSAGRPRSFRAARRSRTGWSIPSGVSWKVPKCMAML